MSDRPRIVTIRRLFPIPPKGESGAARDTDVDRGENMDGPDEGAMKGFVVTWHDTARAIPRPTRFVFALALLCLGLSGCRTDPNILALERENRVLDDQVWYLSDQLDITLQKLEAAKSKLAKCQE